MKFLKNKKNFVYILIIWSIVLFTLLIGCKPQQSTQYTLSINTVLNDILNSATAVALFTTA